MSNFSSQQKQLEERKEWEKIGRETLAKFFYDLGKLAFAGICVVTVMSIVQEGSDFRQWITLAVGTLVTTLFSYIGYLILK